MKIRLDNGPMLAGVLSLILLAWMLSGALADKPAPPPAPAHSQGIDERISVQVTRLVASRHQRYVEMQAQTAPLRSGMLRSEIDGQIKELPVAKGDTVAAGALLARIDIADLPARRSHAQALVHQRNLEYEGARRLHQQGHLSETRLAESAALLESARAELAAIEQQLAHTEIRAPFAGRLDQLPVELGSYLRKGDPVATILDFSTVLVEGDVAEREALLLRPGLPAEIVLEDSQTWSGRLRFISAEANPRTRTFAVEVTIEDDAGPRASGLTAAVRMPVGTVAAHRVSPALLTLDNGGRLGLHAVAEDGRVRFHPIEMIEATTAGIWVTGLPGEVRLITVGSGFVREGDLVRAVEAETPAQEAAGQAS